MSELIDQKPEDFVLLNDYIPEVKINLAYETTQNFTGQVLSLYQAQKAYLTRKAADHLRKVVEQLDQDGYQLVIYDAYRPQSAVNFFKDWSLGAGGDEQKQDYYPFEQKEKLFERGFIALRSGHTRGSTLDISIIKKGNALKAVERQERILKNGKRIIYLNDGTEDFGTHFDFFGESSYPKTDLISKEAQEKRGYLIGLMEKAGFQVSPREWWHFTLKNEPFPDTYFNFPVK